MASRTETDTHNYALRLPRDLHARLLQSAEAGRRSLNSEIVFQLERALTLDEFEAGYGGAAAAEPPDTRSGGSPVSAGAPVGAGGKASPRAPHKTKARSEMCVHRRPVGSFCPKCDT